MTRRLAAVLSLLLAAAAVATAAFLASRDFPRGFSVAVCAVAAGGLTLWSILRRGGARTAGLVVAALLLVAACVLIVVNGRLAENAVLLACVAGAVEAARRAFTTHTSLPSAPRPEHAVLFWNPKSGGGKATRFHLETEAHSRGIETVELQRGDDLEALVRAAAVRGADALAMAGGDGSQAIVARVASELDLPYACVPAGTRNHFALDLGVDREDVVGALDALVNGGERRVDLAEVNGSVFVNNVSLGVYADAVQRDEYRDAKVRTLLDTAAADADHELDLRWSGPDGREESAAPALLVSNNAYRLGRPIASGTRPRFDSGMLGIAVFDGPAAHSGRPWHQWTAQHFEVDASHPVNAGVDGEAVVLSPPLRFASRPAVLRVRIAPDHPGASPSATLPETTRGAVRALVAIALGRAA
jgi:diacylglycerol kinase family enzyme